MVDTSKPGGLGRSTSPAARKAAGAFSLPGKNAAALEGAPIKANLLLLTGYFDRQESLLKLR